MAALFEGDAKKPMSLLWGRNTHEAPFAVALCLRTCNPGGAFSRKPEYRVELGNVSGNAWEKATPERRTFLLA